MSCVTCRRGSCKGCRWIAGATTPKTRGKLHQQLKIPMQRKVPRKLLTSIMATPIGRRIPNPAAVGKRRILVTRLLKQRSGFALNVRK